MADPVTLIVAIAALLSAITAILHTTCRRSECTLQATQDGMDLEMHTSSETQTQA
jgi:hypothetical protein